MREELPSHFSLRPWQSWLVLLSLALVIGIGFQGSRGLWGTTEGRYAETAREMLETGDFLEPTLGYHPHWTKPPLTHWAIAAGMSLLGENEWGARIPNAIAFIVTVLAVAGLGRALWGTAEGNLAGVIYATSILPVGGGAALSTDTILTMCITLAVLCWVKAWRSPNCAGQRWWATAMWGLWGLGFLTKGPVALLPLLGLLLWRRLGHHRFRIVTPAGIGLFLVLGFGWYAVVCLRHPELLGRFLVREVAGHALTGAAGHNHEWYKPFVMYLPALTVGLGLWFGWLLIGLRRQWLVNQGHFISFLKRSEAAAFLFLWIAIPLAVLFLVRSRLFLYVLPLFAPVALATARGITSHARQPMRWRPVIATAMVSAVLIVAAKGVLAKVDSGKDMRQLCQAVQDIALGSGTVIAYEQPKLFGLQFYLGGSLMRTDIDDSEQTDGTLIDILGGLHVDPVVPWTVICVSRETDEVDAVFESLGVHPEAHMIQGWMIYHSPEIFSPVINV